VVLPLARRHSWDDVSAFAAGVAQKAADLAPDRYVATMSKAKRVGRIFIDHFRNGRGATSVAPYSLRARKGAPVAMPVTWDELKSSRAGSDFKLEDAAKRAQSKSDPWADYAKSAQTLSAAAWKALDLKRPK
jgi:bifunctional non-homologous end joining protein LigD